MQNSNTSAPIQKPQKRSRRRQAVIRTIDVPVEIRTELRTGSGTRTLSVRRETETRHLKMWPNGRQELMPRSYTAAVFNGTVSLTSRRNNSRSVFARTDAVYRRIEAHIDGRNRPSKAKEVR